MNLEQIDFFRTIGPKEIEVVKKNSTITSYKKGDFIYLEKNEWKKLHILTEGVIDIYMENSRGKELYISSINSVDIIGGLSVFKKLSYSMTFECLTKCTILTIDCEKTDYILHKNTIFCQKLAQTLSQRVLLLTNLIDDISLNAKERVAKYILQNQTAFKDKTYTYISKKLNMTPETLSRILNNFKKIGFIDVDEKHDVKILDIKKAGR